MVLYKTIRTGVINDITDAATLKRVRGLPAEYVEIKEAPKGAPPADPGGQDPGGNAPEMKKPGK